MNKYTEDQLIELVPEAKRHIVYEDGTFSFDLDETICFSDISASLNLLVDTRAALAKCRKAMEAVKHHTWQYRTGGLSRETFLSFVDVEIKEATE